MMNSNESVSAVKLDIVDRKLVKMPMSLWGSEVRFIDENRTLAAGT